MGLAAMGLAVRAGVLVLIALAGLGEPFEPPKVEVYSRSHASDGQQNTLNCFVSGFHPPKIEITLLKNGEPMSGVKYADMTFDDKWAFQRLVYAPFTPQKGDVYVCRVAHSAFREPQSFRWDSDF
ncbi:beta-2-microglobulin [Tyto alba]|uniref:beta-2-microglobulin n=1 Tax=Tyto alba TaxID=56313 RepID=UPI001C67A6FB|nr:beta-2-microglobulin [Tyto alba]